MKPEADMMLMLSAGKLLGEIAPALPPGYGQGSASTVAITLIALAQEFERAADIRVAENADLRALFARAAATMHDPDLVQRLTAASESRAASLAISALNAANEELRRVLIALHEAVDASRDPRERALSADIWRVLKASADRRYVDIAPL